MVATLTTPSTPARPIDVPLLAWAAVVVALFTIYLLLQENGALLQSSWETLHELFHDGRHALGVPCH
jgi:hypothetical protein